LSFEERASFFFMENEAFLFKQIQKKPPDSASG